MSISEDIRGYAGAVQARLATAAAEASAVAAGVGNHLPAGVREAADRAQGLVGDVAGRVQVTAAGLHEKAGELANRNPYLGQAYGAVESAAGLVVEKVIVPAAGLLGYHRTEAAHAATETGEQPPAA